jgi:hypothetical protein
MEWQSASLCNTYKDHLTNGANPCGTIALSPSRTRTWHCLRRSSHINNINSSCISSFQCLQQSPVNQDYLHPRLPPRKICRRKSLPFSFSPPRLARHLREVLQEVLRNVAMASALPRDKHWLIISSLKVCRCATKVQTDSNATQ